VTVDILNGTDTRTRIILGFTRDEFDDLCATLADWNEFADSDSGTVGKIMRFRNCFTDRAQEQPSASRCCELCPCTGTADQDVCSPCCACGSTQPAADDPS
jgi:hypothetical protein